MKLFKKLMAGVMAVAMLSACTVAFAGSVVSGSVNSGSAAASATVTGAGKYAGKSEAVFLMKLPTAAAANAALTFTVDPNQNIGNSKPSNADPSSPYGTVIFSTVSGTGNNAVVKYAAESAPLKVISMSSVDVKVNMFATLSNTKMTLSTSTTSGFATDSTEHLYLGVQVWSVSSGTATKSGGALPITALGAKSATNLKAVSGNFKSVVSGGSVTTLVSGAQSVEENADKAQDLPEDSWNAVQYTVLGTSNSKADWQIDGLDAPNLTITWKIDPSSVPTYDLDDPAIPTNNSYTAQLDKNAYRASDEVILWVKPTSEEAKLSSVKLTYVNIDKTTGKTKTEVTLPFTVTSTSVNGAYKATLNKFPDDMAKNTTPKGDTTYKSPVWEIELS